MMCVKTARLWLLAFNPQKLNNPEKTVEDRILIDSPACSGLIVKTQRSPELMSILIGDFLGMAGDACSLKE